MLLSALLATLVSAAPVGPTDEGVVYEPKPEPTVEERVEVVAPTPAVVGPESKPPPEPPPLEFSPPPFNLPPPPPPPSGSGRLVGGSFAIALGLGAASVVIVEGTREGGGAQFAAATFIPIGLASVGLGTYLLVRGARARSHFNDWRAYTRSDARPTGDGLVVGGTLSTIIGGVTLVAGAVQTREPNAFDRPLAPTLFAVGATGVAVGLGALTWGLLRRAGYRSWRQSTFLSSLTPTVTPIYVARDGDLRGASFGFVGRL